MYSAGIRVVLVSEVGGTSLRVRWLTMFCAGLRSHDSKEQSGTLPGGGDVYAATYPKDVLAKHTDQQFNILGYYCPA